MYILIYYVSFFFSSRRRHTRSLRDWSSDVCSSDLRQTRSRRNAFQAARCEDGQRCRCQRSDCERQRARRHRQSGCAQNRHIFSSKDGEALIMAGTATATPSTRAKLERARVAAAKLAQLSTAQKNELLLQIADTLEAHASQILHANHQDIQQSGLAGAMRDRLLLDPQRIAEMAHAGR